MNNDIRIPKPLVELPDGVDFLAQPSAWTWIRWGYEEFGITRYFTIDSEVLLAEVREAQRLMPTSDSDQGPVFANLGDFVAYDYRLPRAVGTMLEQQRESGREDAQRAMRAALGL